MATEEMDVALDRTVASLGGGVRRLGAEAALPVVAGWRRGSPLRAARSSRRWSRPSTIWAASSRPASSTPSRSALLMTLGEQVRAVAGEEVGAQVAGSLSRLGALLGSQGNSLSDYGKY